MRMRFIDNDAPQPVGAAVASAAMPARAPDLAWQFAPAQAEDAPAPSAVDWSAYWRSVSRRRWYVLLFAGVVTLLAGLYAQSIQPVFRSTGTLLIESGKTKILSIEEVYNAVSQDREYYQTQVEILRSYDVARRTVVATKLWDEPEFDPRKPVRSWQGQVKDLINPPPKPPPWTPERLADAAVAKYLGAVTIEPVRLSQLVKISFDATDKDLAAKMADATATSFIEADRDTRLKLNLSVTGLLQDRLIALREKLRQSEEELQMFRERSGLVSLSGGQGIAGQQLSELSQRLVAARVRRTELESAYQQVERIGNADSASVPALLNQPGLAEARNRVAAASRQLDEWTRLLGDKHKNTIEARTALATAQAEAQQMTRAVVASMKREAQAAGDTERSLQAALGSARNTVQGVNRQEFQLGVLEREVQTNKQLYELFLSRTKETSVSTNLQAAVARLVDPARPATAPLKPNKPQIVLIALLLSVLAGAVVCIVIDKLSDTLQGSNEAETRLHHRVLATLPTIRGDDLEAASRSFIDDPTSHHAEGIRAARTSILLSSMAVAHKLVLVTSALDEEGKTTFCSNLALAHARTKRTLLVDCDLRNPQIGSRLGLPGDAKGISELVQGLADVKDCVHAISGSTLMVVPAGAVPENTEEFLMSPQFRDTLKSLANRVDIVLIDSPPVNDHSDALIIAQHANDTIYVVKARGTSQTEAHKGLDLLRRAGASILGIVLTNTEAAPQRTARRRNGSHTRAALRA